MIMYTTQAVVKITPDKSHVDNCFSRLHNSMIIHTLTILGQYNTRHLGGYARNIPSPLHHVGRVCLGLSSHYEL